MATRLIVVLAMTLLLPACGQVAAPDGGTNDDATGQPTGGVGGEQVEIAGLAFGQQEITVSAGTTITWVNNDSVGHTVTHGEDGQAVADALVDEPIGTGEEVSFTFDEPGTYPITCTIHPEMNMIVVVE